MNASVQAVLKNCGLTFSESHTNSSYVTVRSWLNYAERSKKLGPVRLDETRKDETTTETMCVSVCVSLVVFAILWDGKSLLFRCMDGTDERLNANNFIERFISIGSFCGCLRFWR